MSGDELWLLAGQGCIPGCIPKFTPASQERTTVACLRSAAGQQMHAKPAIRPLEPRKRVRCKPPWVQIPPSPLLKQPLSCGNAEQGLFRLLDSCSLCKLRSLCESSGLQLRQLVVPLQPGLGLRLTRDLLMWALAHRGSSASLAAANREVSMCCLAVACWVKHVVGNVGSRHDAGRATS